MVKNRAAERPAPPAPVVMRAYPGRVLPTRRIAHPLLLLAMRTVIPRSPDPTPSPSAPTIARDLNALQPAGMTCGLVILHPDPADPNDLDAILRVWWFATEAELDRAYSVATFLADLAGNEPAMKRLDDLADTQYAILDYGLQREQGDRFAITFGDRAAGLPALVP